MGQPQRIFDSLGYFELRLGKDIQRLVWRLTALEYKLDAMKYELLTKLGGLMVVLFTLFSGLIVGLIKFIH